MASAVIDAAANRITRELTEPCACVLRWEIGRGRRLVLGAPFTEMSRNMLMILRSARVLRTAGSAVLLAMVACARVPRAAQPAGALSPALEANKAVVRRFYAALNAGDYAAADALVSADYRHYVVTDTGFRAISWAAFKAGNQGARSAFPDWTLGTDLLIADGEYVAALVTGRGTHRGDFAGIRATGRSVRVPIAVIHQVRAGRLVADWEVANTEPSMSVLRAGSPP